MDSGLLSYAAVYTHTLFYALVAFLKKLACIKRPKSKMIFLSERRDWRKRTQPAKGRYTDSERAQINKWCKWARRVEIKQKGVKQGLGVLATSAEDSSS